jgi:hypothetical protein
MHLCIGSANVVSHNAQFSPALKKQQALHVISDHRQPKLRTIVANLTASMKPDRLGPNAMRQLDQKMAQALRGDWGLRRREELLDD